MLKKAIILALFAWASPALAATFYVDGACGSSGDGTTQTCGGTGPFKTIGESISSMSAGNTILVKAGTYGESITISGKNGTAGSRILLQAFESGTVVMDGSGVAAPTTSGFHISSSSYLTVDGIDSIDWGSNKHCFGIFSSSANIIVTNFVASNCKSGVRAEDSNSITLSNGTSSGNFFHGIYYENVDIGTVDTVISHSNSDPGENDGFHIDDSRDVLVVNSIAYGNAEQGFDASGHCDHCAGDVCSATCFSSQRVTFRNCVAYDNGEVPNVGGFKLEGYRGDNLVIENSIAFSNDGLCGICVMGSKDSTVKNSTSWGNLDGLRVTNCSLPCVQGYQTGILIRDNIFFDDTDQLTVGTSNTSITLNYNGYFVSPDDPDGFDYRGCPTENLGTFNEYQSCSGQDANSAAGNPLFVNTADPDGADNIWFTADDGLLLQAGSPYKNAASDGLDMGYRILSSDVTAPSTVSNLAAGSPTDDCITLTWTAPGDDAGVGTATTYDIRRALLEIGDGAKYTTATQIDGEPAPKIAGSAESFQVCGLSASTAYYFALKAIDEAPNFNTSALSNSPTATTTAADSTAPSAVSNLAVTAVPPTYSCVNLTWTASGDDAGVGTATTYDARWSASSIGDDSAFNAATPIAGEPTPRVAGSSESFDFCNLAPSTQYFFAIKTSDEIPNTSLISNSPNETTTGGPERPRRSRVPFIRSGFILPPTGETHVQAP
jgi:hypothetical protein